MTSVLATKEEPIAWKGERCSRWLAETGERSIRDILGTTDSKKRHTCYDESDGKQKEGAHNRYDSLVKERKEGLEGVWKEGLGIRLPRNPTFYMQNPTYSRALCLPAHTASEQPSLLMSISHLIRE